MKIKRLLRKFLEMDDDKNMQISMWDSMQRSGYFKKHIHYKDWSPDMERPPAVLRNYGLEKKELPEPFKNIDFCVDEHILELTGNPFETFNKEIDPALKETEELWLQKIISLNNKMVVLDIGCGYGRTEAWMWRYVKEIHGIDISGFIIKICKERFSDIENVHFYNNKGDDLSMFGSQMFDFVYSFNVFQHIPRRFTANYLKEVRRVLKKNGIFLFNILSGINTDVDSGPSGTEWAIGYNRADMEEKIINAGLKLSRTLTFRIKGVEPYWIWFIVNG